MSTKLIKNFRTGTGRLPRNALAVALSLGLAGIATAQAQDQADQAAAGTSEATTLDRIEVTGSRIKRATVEGALPITVISREDIEISGKTTVADLLQQSTFNSFGSYTPSSGSSAAGFTGISLRGLGEGRTLILIDGRRAPTSPLTGEGQDLTSIPLAAVERVEILADGASAIYGADAVGGVVNIILRKDYSGVQVSGGTNTVHWGGDSQEGSIIFGQNTERGSLMAGVSYTSRDITYVDDYPWTGSGQSTYSNNYLQVETNPETGERQPGSYLTTNGSAVVGDCDGENFYTNAAGTRCYYDYIAAGMADTASVDAKSAFLRGTYQLSDNWTGYLNTYLTHKKTESIYAPVPESIYVSADSPNNTTGQEAYIKHRFSELGNRIDETTEDDFDITVGVQGQINDRVSLDVGVRDAQAVSKKMGYNYVNIPVAEELFESGEYNALDPESNSEEVLDQIRTTITRDMYFKQREYFANLNADLFNLPGGVSQLALGAEYREEDYQDKYDAQSEAGNVGGSAGNSAWGSRQVTSAYAEWNLPFLTQFEADLAVRQDSYSDFGDATSPKLSLRYQPLENLTFRASYGEGFRAPTLQALNQQTAYSADTVTDPQTAEAYGLSSGTSIQINAYRLANPDLQPETSKQFSAGLIWDATDWLNVTLDYYRTKIENQIKFYSATTVLERTANGQYLPDQYYVVRNDDGSISAIYTGYGNEGLVKTDGVDLTINGRWDLGGGRLTSRLQGSWIHSYTIDDEDGSDEYIGHSGYPEWRASLTTRWEYSDFSVAWTVNAMAYDPAYYVDYYEGTYSCQQLVDWGYADRCSGAYITHDLQFTYTAPWNGQISLGALNVTDEAPPYDAAYTEGFNDYLYNGYGRQVYLRYTQKF